MVCSFYNAKSEPYFLSSENLVKEIRSDFCSPINTIIEEVWKIKIFFSGLRNYRNLSVQCVWLLK